jgi:hypothetical protein
MSATTAAAALKRLQSIAGMRSSIEPRTQPLRVSIAVCCVSHRVKNRGVTIPHDSNNTR